MKASGNNGATQLLAQAVSAFQSGNIIEARRLCESATQTDQNNIGALHLLAVVEALQNNPEGALGIFDRALNLSPHNADILADKGKVLTGLGQHHNALLCYQQAILINPAHGNALHNLGATLLLLKRPAEALVKFDQLLKIIPNYAPAFNNRGEALKELGRGEKAVASYRQAIFLDPQDTKAWCNLGDCLLKLKRHDEAFAAYDKALALKPDLPEAWLGRGNAFGDLKRYDEAFAAYDNALALKPDLAMAWLGRGNIFAGLKRYDEAFAAYGKASTLMPDLEGAWLGRGNALVDLKRYHEAFAAYDKALALKPDLAEALLGRGNAFGDLKRHDEAFAAYDRALALKPDLAEAWLGRGNLFNELKVYDQAFDAYSKAFAIKPDIIGVEGARLHAKMHLCDWTNLNIECSHLISSVKSGNANTPPFPFLAIPSSAEDQLHCAKLWIAHKHPPSNKPAWQGERYRHDRIRVAYLSADFHQHATSYLMAGLFECHDRSRFEITAISLGPLDNSQIQTRLMASFEHFIDAQTLSDYEIYSRIKELEVDILVDLKGFTQGARTDILALKPAPVQINYLGYPGTMGAEYIDYIVADRTLVPEDSKQYYSEKVAYLPNSYQVNDDKRPIAERLFTRTELGLPATGFIFCCFNNSYKITPDVFDSWMRMLKQSEGSILWLLEANGIAEHNLRKEAAARSVNPDRLIFAKRLSLADHLARHSMADLFLDTLPYNAHTTASDALWAGLPVLTCLGGTFAGRVAASLLNAIHLPELVVSTSEAYERMAVDLAAHPEKMATIKRKLADNRLTTPLFDTKLLTKNLEAAYTAMYQRHQLGLSPDHIVVPN